MRATVFFKDGHTEEVVYSNCFVLFPFEINPTNDLYFDTKSGQYKYVDRPTYEELSIKDNIRIPRIPYAFYKYNDYYNEWFVDDSINKVEFYTNEYQES
jgi:hypothetical protein